MAVRTSSASRPSRSRRRSGGCGSGRSSGPFASTGWKRSSKTTNTRRKTMAEAATIQISAPIQRIGPDTIRLERVLDAPAETVWRYLTQAELRRQWFMGGTDAKAAGSEFELLNDHDNLS